MGGTYLQSSDRSVAGTYFRSLEGQILARSGSRSRAFSGTFVVVNVPEDDVLSVYAPLFRRRGA